MEDLVPTDLTPAKTITLLLSLKGFLIFAISSSCLLYFNRSLTWSPIGRMLPLCDCQASTALVNRYYPLKYPLIRNQE
jgi:hypothetical protein